jgi:hypothetical protein
MEIFLAATAGALVLGGALAVRAIKKRIKKWRRRKGGVYLVRMDHHRNRARRVNGYVGETVSFHFRKRQHLGSSHFPVAGGKRTAVATKTASQPWSDLNPVWHHLALPWWLCWKWVLRPLETLVIWCTWPIYNDAKNRWNPRRISKGLAAVQRRERDNLAANSMWYQTEIGLAHGARIAVQVAGAIVIMIGIYGWVVTR